MTNDRKSLKFPRLWWGWLGKQSNLDESEYRKQQQNRFRKKQKKGWSKFIRQFKKWILRN